MRDESVKTKRIVLGVLACALVSAVAFAQGFVNFKELLTGYEEVPSVSTGANGEFTAQIRKDSTVDWELSYSGLEGTVQQAHIHLGQQGVNGGISVFLCSNLTTPAPPPGTQACPAPPATISGVFRASNVIGPAAQGIAPGQFDELIAAMRAGATYVNVHSSTWPGGEIRSQIDHQGNH